MPNLTLRSIRTLLVIGEPMQKVHLILGYAGLIPFIGLAILAIAGYEEASYFLLTYAALILSFLGGIVWMATIAAKKHWSLAVVSNVVMLIAWVAVIVSNTSWSLPLIGALMLGLLFIESRHLRSEYTDDFFRLRKYLTFIAAASLFSTAAFA